MDNRVTYVLDTSAVLSEPACLFGFEEHRVVVPLVVLTELEAKRGHPDLGWSARTALRSLESLRERNGTLLDEVTVNDAGGTLRVEINHVQTAGLPEAFVGSPSNDNRILAVARNLAAEGHRVTLVSQDLPLRLKAGVVGLAAEEFRGDGLSDAGWTGVTELEATAAEIDRFYADGVLDIEPVRQLVANTGVVVHNGSASALGYVDEAKTLRRLPNERSVFGMSPRSKEQHFAAHLLTDDRVGIVSLGGPAGTGKSVLALAAGLDAVLERRIQSRVIVFRPLYAVGGQELGYLPGSESEKMAPWAAAVFDALDAIAGPEVVDHILHEELVEVQPLTHLRGRSLTDAFVIIDEAQNLERNVLLTALSRVGHGTKVVMTHDVAQRDNLHVGRHDGIASVVDRLKGHPLFGHVTLQRSERSQIAALVSTVLDAGR